MTRLDALFRGIADEQDALRAGSRLEERLVLRVGRSALPKRRLRRSWVLSLAAAVSLASIVAVVVASNPRVLAVSVGGSGGNPLLGAWLAAPDAKPVSLEFSDGSRFELTPRSKARVVELRADGARVELASGGVKVHVIPRRATNFRLDAGPFGVRVTGTRFEVTYDPEHRAFELFLEEGQVELTGCAFGKGRKLAAGQRVSTSCGGQAVDVSYGPRPVAKSARADASPPAAAPEASVPSPPEGAVGAEQVSHEEGAPPPSARPERAPSTGWLLLARAGSYQEAFAAVRAQGFESECARADSEALSLLADVARHAGAPAQAKQALLAQRGRFPGTNDAALAAFALGRLEFDEYGAYPRAATWFRTYLGERPGGTMTREALGRLLEATYRANDLAEARAVAARYLREYPSGPHAEFAMRVVDAP